MTKKLSLSEKNKKFWAMPKAKQRVAVAKDVLKELATGFYNPSHTYFRSSDLYGFELMPNTGLDKVLAKIKKSGGSCDVCGIGACFTSLVRLGDKVSAGVFDPNDFFGEIDDTPMRNALKKVFPDSQVCLIECAFETNPWSGNDKSVSYGKRQMAREFGDKYYNKTERLEAIMKNIIKNKGEFKP